MLADELERKRGKRRKESALLSIALPLDVAIPGTPFSFALLARHSGESGQSVIMCKDTTKLKRVEVLMLLLLLQLADWPTLTMYTTVTRRDKHIHTSTLKLRRNDMMRRQMTGDGQNVVIESVCPRPAFVTAG